VSFILNSSSMSSLSCPTCDDTVISEEEREEDTAGAHPATSDCDRPCGWVQAKDANEACSLTILPDKRTVSYWPRVFGKVSCTISDRPLVGVPAERVSGAASDAPFVSPWPYFEVLIINRGYYGSIAIGLAVKSHPAGAKPGTVPGSYAWHGNGNEWADGKHSVFPAEDEAIGEDEKGEGIYFQSGDVIGCGLNDITSEIFYTKNGRFLGVGHRKVSMRPESPLHAVVSLAGPQEKVFTNFGQLPFLWDFHYCQTVSPATASVHQYFLRCASLLPGLAHLLRTSLEGPSASACRGCLAHDKPFLL
jgi:endogenous inhibitor of DNA gyrase (YacG/DUF329 family)